MTIGRSGDDGRDLQLLQNLFAVLMKHNKGDDQIELCIAANGHERVELELPHVRLRYSKQLHEELVELVGPDMINVEVC